MSEDRSISTDKGDRGTSMHLKSNKVTGPSRKGIESIAGNYPWLSRKEIRFSNMQPASHTNIPLT